MKTKSAPKLKKLEPLELKECHTIGQILLAMSKTPVGSGMLGRLAIELRNLIAAGERPIVVFDGDEFSPLGQLIKKMEECKWFFGPITPYHYDIGGWKGRPVLVLGRFLEQHEKGIEGYPSRSFFVNQWGLAIEGHIQDGHFQDVVVADPRLVMPLVFAAFDEWFRGRPHKVDEEFLSWLESFGGTAREFVQGTRVVKAMTDDSDCTVVFTMTGVVTVAQMSPIICDLIEAGKVQVIVTTGALLGHGLVYSLDLPHFRHDPDFDDVTLAEFKLNRVTDAIEPETNLDHVENVVGQVLNDLPEAVLGSAGINWLIGEHLEKEFPAQRGVLKSAAEKNVPVIIPAFYDSELGNDLITHNRRCKREGMKSILMNLEIDMELLIQILTKTKRRGIFTLGGGPPRNTPQNVGPLVEILNNRLGLDMPVPMYHYGCRVCPDPIWLGHLGGCTYSEGISWRKFFPDAQLAEVHMDALHGFPFLAKYVLS